MLLGEDVKTKLLAVHELIMALMKMPPDALVVTVAGDMSKGSRRDRGRRSSRREAMRAVTPTWTYSTSSTRSRVRRCPRSLSRPTRTGMRRRETKHEKDAGGGFDGRGAVSFFPPSSPPHSLHSRSPPPPSSR